MQLRYFPSNSSITDMSISLAGVELHVETKLLAQHAFRPARRSGGVCRCQTTPRADRSFSASLGLSASCAAAEGYI